MTTTNSYSRQPTKQDYADPTKFKFSIVKLPKVEYFCTQVNLPGISISDNYSQPTPFRDIPLPGEKLSYEPLSVTFIVDENLETKNVNIFVRPEAVKLSQEQTPVNGVKGTVMASKLMGSYSFVHLSVLNDDNEIIHVHSHMPPNFLPNQSSAVGIELDSQQTFIFPSN